MSASDPAEPAPTAPVAGVDYPRTHREFRAMFPDDDSCAAYLERLW